MYHAVVPTFAIVYQLLEGQIFYVFIVGVLFL